MTPTRIYLGGQETHYAADLEPTSDPWFALKGRELVGERLQNARIAPFDRFAYTIIFIIVVL